MSGASNSEEIEALRRSLERRFRTAITGVRVAGEAIELLHPASAEELISQEDFDRDERLPYWADVWPSSLVLATRLRTERGAGRRLLELGCGVGLVGIAAARAGFGVTVSDYYADALDFARVNAAANGVSIAARLIDWRELPADLGTFNVVAASDVLYERRYGPMVAAAVAATLALGGVALVADPGRVGAEAFVEECARLNLAVTSGEPIAHRAGEAVQRVRVYELEQQNSGRRMRN